MKHCEKRRKCWLPAFSPFPTIFSRAFFFKDVKSRDSVVKSQAHFSLNMTHTSGDFQEQLQVMISMDKQNRVQSWG